MDIEKELIYLADRIRALSQNGLVYSTNEYDTERYDELLGMSNKIISLVSGHTVKEISDCFHVEDDYVTPKVDIRAVVFNNKAQILLVKEKADGLWSLPGGWADIGFTPKEIAVKEVKEETGLDVIPTRLLAVFDKSRHKHPPALHYAYKIFILCELQGGDFTNTFDILDKGFFPENALPPLSVERVTEDQIKLMYEYKNNPTKEVLFD